MKYPACENCRYWDDSISAADSHDDTGLCRRAAPMVDDRSGRAMWALTEADDWCGEFEEATGANSRPEGGACNE